MKVADRPNTKGTRTCSRGRATARRSGLARGLQAARLSFGNERPAFSITFFGITGGAERWLKIPLDLSQPPVSYAAQALAVVRRTPVVQFFGATTGFIVNYTPDHAVRFDLQGNPVETLTRAYRPMEVTLTIGRREMSAERFGQILGTIQKEEDSTPPN